MHRIASLRTGSTGADSPGPARSKHSTDRGVRDRPRLGSRVKSGAGSRIDALHWVVLLLATGAFFALVPLWAPLVMAAWTALLVRPLHQRATHALGRSGRAAALLTVGFVLAALVPLSLLGISLTTEAIALARRVLSSNDGAAALLSIVNGGGASPKDGLPSLSALRIGPSELVDFMRQHGTSTWHALSKIAGATATALVGVFVFVLGFYAFLVDGKRAYDWMAEHAPLERGHFHRLAQAFAETGRGLFVGVGLTALGQGALATVGYFALGLPQAAVLGALTVLAAFIPSAGAALVWAPVSVGLALSGRTGAALAMLAIGLFVSTADNFVRPWLSRFGQLRLPTFLLLIAMLGGIVTFGTWGLVLGPLFVRLAVEGLEILHEHTPNSDRSAAHG